jgi:Fe-S-cluster containining protein
MENFDQKLLACTRADLEAAWPVLAADVLRQVDSPARADDFAREMKDDPEIDRVFSNWDELDQASRGPVFRHLTETLTRAAYATRPYCLGCGQCCRRSGPALFVEDRDLIESGRLDPAFLLTLRAGERGFSPIEDRVVVIEHEMVMVKSGPGQGCPWHDPAIGCRIYDHRPRQCRQLKCWNPESMTGLADLEPLSRGRISLDELTETLVARQADEAAFWRLAEAVRAYAAGDASAPGRAVELMEADLALRRDAERAGLDPAGFEFWFGRPLVTVLPSLGWRLVRDDTGQWTLAEAEPEGPDQSL